MLHLLLTALKKTAVFVLSRELKLRNYTPEDEELKERQVPKAKPASGKNSLHTNTNSRASVIRIIHGLQEGHSETVVLTDPQLLSCMIHD